MTNEKELRREYPLHWVVFRNDYENLMELLEEGHTNEMLDKLDVRGRTPLMLAITLGHYECARALLEKGANAAIQNAGWLTFASHLKQGKGRKRLCSLKDRCAIKNGFSGTSYSYNCELIDSTSFTYADMWSPSHEAICAGNSDLLRLIIQYRDYQRALQTSSAMGRLLTLLKETSDFYAEMSWEFTSWLPFVSKICPSDTYKIYKRGSNVRIDTTLVGFDITSNWKRGNQSFIFRFSDNCQAQLIVLDHDSKT
ncbi:unnamed protein product, partial [Acanthocheilonema viteae]